MGLVDEPKHGDVVRLFCPGCQDVYNVSSPSMFRSIDGAFFGPTFPSLFFMTYEDLVPAKTSENYIPRVFGFKVHQSRKSVPSGHNAVLVGTELEFTTSGYSIGSIESLGTSCNKIIELRDLTAPNNPGGLMSLETVLSSSNAGLDGIYIQSDVMKRQLSSYNPDAKDSERKDDDEFLSMKRQRSIDGS